MSQSEILTQHAMLVVWGQFGHCLGLIEKLSQVPLHQKTVVHSPQTKVLEFLVAILGGCAYLKDLSRSAHPIDQDPAVATAWGQAAWADYSGVSRLLTEMSMAEARQIEQVLLQVSQPLIDQEVMLALQQTGELVYDGDLTGRQVSNTSRTYPGAAYGYMGEDHIGLGYQAALVCLESPKSGRLWLSAVQHPGNTLSNTQAEALVLAAEVRTGLYPRRRVELLRQRLASLGQAVQWREEKLQQAEKRLAQAQTDLQAVEDELGICQQDLAKLEAKYSHKLHLERPRGYLGQARAKLSVYQARLQRKQKRLEQAQRAGQTQKNLLEAVRSEQRLLQERLQRFEQDNAAMVYPIRAVFRLDGGFGTVENLALLIEMGYEVYTKSFSNLTTQRLKRQAASENSSWAEVGVNAQMIVWKDQPLRNFPYRVDLALERFYADKGPLFNSLIHFGDTPVTTNAASWFHHYNHRQIIEAGIKEGKGTFEIRHLKVRSEAGLFLQEKFTMFAANFVRWADQWLVEQCQSIPDAWQHTAQPAVKEQVKVGAQTSAWVSWHEQDCLLRFTDLSLFAGRSFDIKRQWAYQLVLPFAKNRVFSTF